MPRPQDPQSHGMLAVLFLVISSVAVVTTIVNLAVFMESNSSATPREQLLLRLAVTCPVKPHEATDILGYSLISLCEYEGAHGPLAIMTTIDRDGRIESKLLDEREQLLWIERLCSVTPTLDEACRAFSRSKST